MGKRDYLMLKSDSIVSSLMNKKTSIQFLLSSTEKTLLKRNIALRDESKKNGEICFVVGNGPSGGKETIDRILDYPKITVNFFHKGGNLHSNYHLMIDPGFYSIDAYKDYAYQLIENESETKMILSTDVARNIFYESPLPENVYCINTALVQYGKNLAFDMTMPMTSCPNVIPLAIQCVLFMGYKRIYLVGCEFGLYGSPRAAGGHFYEKSRNRNPHEHDSPESLIRCGLVHMHHEAIIQYCDEQGVEIKNLSPSTNLGEYDLDDLDKVLEKI